VHFVCLRINALRTGAFYSHGFNRRPVLLPALLYSAEQRLLPLNFLIRPTRPLLLCPRPVKDRFGQPECDCPTAACSLWEEHTGESESPVRLCVGEIYDPVSNRFHTTVGSMATPRDRQRQRCCDGRVLIAGGQDTSRPSLLKCLTPGTESLQTLTETLTVSRMAHSASRCSTGPYSLTGDATDKSIQLRPRKLFDPAQCLHWPAR